VRQLGWALAAAVLALALAVRAVAAGTGDLGPDDLALYEERSYGTDLPDWYGRQPFFLLWSLGDGQAFVTLAVDLDLDEAAIGLANPVYRFSRVGYSWLGRLFALGQKDLVPIGLLATNVVSLVVLTLWLFSLRGDMGWWPLLGLANPALYIAFASDTAELLGVTLATLALTAPPGLIGWASAAALGATRPELATVLPAAVRPFYRVLLTGMVALGVRVVGVLAMGPEGSIFGGGSIGWPLVGYLETWRGSLVPSVAGSAVFLLTSLLTIYVGVTRRRGVERLAWVLTASLMLVLTPNVSRRPGNYLRAAAPLWLLWTIPTSRSTKRQSAA